METEPSRPVHRNVGRDKNQLFSNVAAHIVMGWFRLFCGFACVVVIDARCGRRLLAEPVCQRRGFQWVPMPLSTGLTLGKCIVLYNTCMYLAGPSPSVVSHTLVVCVSILRALTGVSPASRQC